MSILKYTGVGTAWAENAATTTPPTTSTTTDAKANPVPSTPGGSFLHMLPMLVLFVLVFYFLLIRPQAKRAKDQKKLLGGVTLGDEVMTAGGMVGRVVKLKDNFVVIAIAKGVEITMQKGSIASILPKGTMESLD
jgi:preprotein translocase subunit YajC